MLLVSPDDFICRTSHFYEAEGVNHSDEVDTGDGQTLNGNDEMRDRFNEIVDKAGPFYLAPL